MLSAENLSCRRGGRTLFRDLGFTVEAGGFVLVTGINGSGKSSLLRLLAGLIAPLAGVILWQEAQIAEDLAAHRGRSHYIGHLDALKPHVTVHEMLGYWKALRGGDKQEMIPDAFAIAKFKDHPIRLLSAGQKRRLSLTRLVLDAAPLWLLDEPTTALDREGQTLLRLQIQQHRARGGIVIAASHDDLQIPDIQTLDMTVALS